MTTLTLSPKRVWGVMVKRQMVLRGPKTWAGNTASEIGRMEATRITANSEVLPGSTDLCGPYKEAGIETGQTVFGRFIYRKKQTKYNQRH